MNIVQAWRDPEYRATLSADELTALPEHPCGPVELGDDALAQIAGARTEGLWSIGCCGGFTENTWCGSCAPTCQNRGCSTMDGQATCTVCTA